MSKVFLMNGISMVTETCPRCQTVHAFEEAIYKVAKARSGSAHVYCPNGHSWVYPSPAEASENEETRLERDRLKQQLAQKDDEIRAAYASAAAALSAAKAAKAQATKIRKRIDKGVCPCCNRQFQDLARHMASKHRGEALQ